MFFEFLLLIIAFTVLGFVRTENYFVYVILSFIISWLHNIQRNIDKINFHLRMSDKEEESSSVNVGVRPMIVNPLRRISVLSSRELVSEYKKEIDKQVKVKEVNRNRREEIKVDDIWGGESYHQEEVEDVADNIKSNANIGAQDSFRINNNTNYENNGAKRGTNPLVWIAGISAILGVFFLVKFLVNHGILTPSVRLLLLSLGAGATVLFGYKLFGNNDFADSKRISQVLMSVGLVALYYVAYSMSKLYMMVPVSSSFALMCGVTIWAIYLSVKIKEEGIAILTMFGGFLAPMLVSDSPAGTAFSSLYLLVLYAGIAFSGMSSISPLVMIMAFFGFYLWGVLKLFVFTFMPYDTIWVMLSVVGVCIISSFADNMKKHEDAKALKLISMIMCGVFSFLCLTKTNFGVLEWCMCGSILATFVGLSFVKPKEHIVPAIVCAGIMLVLLIASKMYNKVSLPMYAIMAGIAILPYYFYLLKRYSNIVYAMYMAIITPAFLLGAYLLYGEQISIVSIGLISGVLMLLPILSGNNYLKEQNDISGVCVLSAASMISFSVCLKFDMYALVVFSSIEILIFSLIKSKTNIKFLEIGVGLLMIWLFYLLRHPVFVIIAYLLPMNLLGAEIHQGDITIWSMLFLGVVPFCCFACAYLLSKDVDMCNTMKKLSVMFLGATVLAFIAYMTMYINESTVYEMDIMGYSFITDVLLLSVVALMNNNLISRDCLLGVSLFRLSLMCMAMFISIHNSDAMNEGMALVVYGMPIVLLWTISYLNKYKLPFTLYTLTMLSFVLITVILNIGLTGQASCKWSYLSGGALFMYSICWFVLAMGWLACAFRVKEMVKPAFGLIYFVIAKIFIYDVSNLNDFWRIISLFALAGALLVVSHVYTAKFKSIDNS